jgi:DNA polymerase III alpha subunit
MLRPPAESSRGTRGIRKGGPPARELIRRLPRIPEYDLPRRIALELETLDLAVSGHPLEMFGPDLLSDLDVNGGGRRVGAKRGGNGVDAKLDGRRLVRSIDLPRLVGDEVALVGWKVTWKATRAANTMKEMIFVTFSDQWGRFEATLFPEAYRRAAPALVRGPGPFLVHGRVESELGVESLTANQLIYVEKQSAVDSILHAGTFQ